MLSGEELPEGTYHHSDIKVNSHSGRFATLTVTSDGFRWLADNGEIEWIETSPYFLPSNTVGSALTFKFFGKFIYQPSSSGLYWH